MPNNHSAFKRSELAQCYFPDLKPMSAWEKFKDWMDASARLRPLLSLTRRTYTPAEVQLIYDVLGEPWEYYVSEIKKILKHSKSHLSLW